MNRELLVDAYRRYKEAVEDLYFLLSRLEHYPRGMVAVAAARFKGKLLAGPTDEDWDFLLDALAEVGE